jgi:hypothetical protein
MTWEWMFGILFVLSLGACLMKTAILQQIQDFLIKKLNPTFIIVFGSFA